MIERIVKQLLCLFVMATCLLGFVGFSMAGEESLESFLDRIQEGSDKVNSFSCNFTQEKRLALFAGPVSFEGRLFIDRPDKLRWEFISPVSSALLFYGDKGARCNDQMVLDTFDLATDPVMKIVATQLWLWLGGDYKQLDKMYNLEKKGEAVLVVTPAEQETAEYVSSVQIFFDEKDLQPVKVEIIEPGGDMTTIIFSNSIINAELPASLFTDCRNE